MDMTKRRYFPADRIEGLADWRFLKNFYCWKNFRMGASEMQEIFKIGQTFQIINEIAMGQDFEISFIS